ncbi:MAG TPA: glycosyltransferase family 4 protein [Vicinamibacterales bacterium]|nr:glycosyltransferase family 4 protein [Vicinamibacterales bacterium]
MNRAARLAKQDNRALLTVVRPGLPIPTPESGETVVGLDELAGWLKSPAALSRLGRYGESRMLVHRLESAGRPLPLALTLRWMTRGAVRIEDVLGRRRAVDAATLARWLRQTATEPFKIDALLRRIEHTIRTLEQDPAHRRQTTLDLTRSPLYLRSDLSFGVRAGGSVGHIAGVVNELEHFAAPPILVTTDDIATVSPRVEQHLVAPPEAFWNFRELPTFVLNETLEQDAVRALAGRTPAFVYQRYSVNNYTGVRLSRELGVPFVLEYNGSEIWMSRHWGRPLAHERLSDRIERLNLRAADLVIVVSTPMKDEIVARGTDDRRVLVNPNGVDAERYSPRVEGTAVRAKFGAERSTVIGFIGTFGPWHGAETLARAYVNLRASRPPLAADVKLMMIGAGARLEAVRSIITEGGAADSTIFTGLVAQEEGPIYLAACDVLVSPHVPNPDGTPFFGSPTKLFEYMAMGKGIVASKLDQIGEVLQHEKTAILVPPGDVDALAAGLSRLVEDRALRNCLGAEARRVAIERYTWRAHVQRTVEALDRGVRL